VTSVLARQALRGQLRAQTTYHSFAGKTKNSAEKETVNVPETPGHRLRLAV